VSAAQTSRGEQVELHLSHHRHIAVVDAGGTAQRLGQRRQRRPRGHRFGAAHQHLDGSAAGAHTLEQLQRQTRLARSGGAGDLD
jgi:hypothetical protein